MSEKTPHRRPATFKLDDSNVVAAILGSVSIAGVDQTDANATKFGVAFRTSAGTPANISVAGASKAIGSSIGQFNFLGLPG